MRLEWARKFFVRKVLFSGEFKEVTPAAIFIVRA
jgi:hypothetical protein